MRLTPEAMKRLFHPTVERIKSAIGDILNSPDVKGNLIKQAMFSLFPHLYVIQALNIFFSSVVLLNLRFYNMKFVEHLPRFSK